MHRVAHVFAATFAAVLALSAALPAAAKDAPKHGNPTASTKHPAAAPAVSVTGSAQPAPVPSAGPAAVRPDADLLVPSEPSSTEMSPTLTAPVAEVPAPMPQPDAAAPGHPDEAAPEILRLVQAPLLPAGGTNIPILALPLLTGLWLILAARLATAAWRQRNRRIQRLAAALNLEAGVARQLTNLPPTALSRLEERVEAVAFDDMTGVLRRGPGLAALEREVARADRTGITLAIAFVDIDGLKQVNDNEGHAAGDALIKAVAAALERRLRAADLVFRYGGDEFICVLPDTHREDAVRVLDTIQRDAWSVGARFSFGVAAYRAGDTAEDLLERADARLYEGRHREREPLRLIRPA